MILTLEVSISLQDVSAAAGPNLQLALLNPQSAGLGFDSLNLQIFREGVTALSVSFNSLAAAQSYFADRVVDLGALSTNVSGTLDLRVVLSLEATGVGDAFGAHLLFGSSNPIPEPRVWLLLLLAGLASLVRVRGSSRPSC